jgi:hypothetical protein
MLDLNAHLPFSKEILQAECDRLAENAETMLSNILLQGSSRSVLPSVAFLNLKVFIMYLLVEKKLVIVAFCDLCL